MLASGNPAPDTLSATANPDIIPRRGYWWISLVIILLVGGLLRYTGYNFSLPYIDHPDEPNFNLAAQMTIDYGSPKPMNLEAYPPGIIAVNYVLLRFFHNPSEPPSTIIGVVRLISISFNLGVGLIIALLGYHIATPLSGLLAAGLWMIMPLIVEYSRYATADNFVAFFTLAALYVVIISVKYDRDSWATAGIVLLMLAIVFKYQALFVSPLILAAPLWRLRRRSAYRQILKNFAVNSVYLALFFVWLVLLTPMLDANKIPNWVAPTDQSTFPSLSTLSHNFQITLAAITAAILIPGITGLFVFVAQRFQEKKDLSSALLVITGGGLWLIGVSFYGQQSFRQFVALAGLMILLCGIGFGAWATVIQKLLIKFIPTDKTLKRSPSVSSVTITLIVTLLSLPSIRASIANAQNHSLPDRRNDLAAWMDATLTPGPYIATEANHKTFNRAWGGYNGVNEFPLAEWAELTARPIGEWREKGVLYAILGFNTYEEIKDPEYLDQTLLLKTYPPSRLYRGPDMVVLRLYPIQHRTQGTLGSINLIGYDIDRVEVSPGETVNFTLYWQASEPTDAEYVVFNHLVPQASSDLVTQIDGLPLPDVRRPSTTWNDPQEILVSRPFSLTIGTNITPGNYRLVTGFYRRDNLSRLYSPDNQDNLLVTTISVTE